jgi:hypothetical protein
MTYGTADGRVVFCLSFFVLLSLPSEPVADSPSAMLLSATAEVSFCTLPTLFCTESSLSGGSRCSTAKLLNGEHGAWYGTILLCGRTIRGDA